MIGRPGRCAGRKALPRKFRLGAKVRDEMNHFPTYETLRVVDGYGLRVDPRFGKPDRYKETGR